MAVDAPVPSAVTVLAVHNTRCMIAWGISAIWVFQVMKENVDIFYFSKNKCITSKINSSWPSDAMIRRQIWVNIGEGNSLLSAGTKPLPEPVLTNHQWSLWGQFHRKYSRELFLTRNTISTLQPHLRELRHILLRSSPRASQAPSPTRTSPTRHLVPITEKPNNVNPHAYTPNRPNPGFTSAQKVRMH